MDSAPFRNVPLIDNSVEFSAGTLAARAKTRIKAKSGVYYVDGTQTGGQGYGGVEDFMGWTGSVKDGFNVWFGSPKDDRPEDETPSEVYSLSIFAGESNGIVNTTTKTSISTYGYYGADNGTGDGSQRPTGGNNFLLRADHGGVSLNLADDKENSLFANSEHLEIISKDGDNAYLLPYKLTLYNSNDQYITLDTDSNVLFMGGGGTDDQVYLDKSKLFIKDGSYFGSYETDKIYITNGTNSVSIPMPPDGDASWQQLEICNGEETKTMWVLGTPPK